MKNACLTAEKVGLDLFTTTDHFMNMANPSGEENHPLECWTLLGALASITNRIRIGPLVSCYGYRAPTLLGKIASTVDIISNGRLLMGLGAGWHEPEFKGFYGRFPPTKERLKGFKDTLAIVYSMFKNDYTTYNGEVFSTENTLNSPRPIQEHVPIMVGAFGEKMIGLATRYADIIHCMFDPNPDNLTQQKQKIIEECKKTGRNPQEIRIGSGYTIWLDPTEEEINQRVKRLQTWMNIPEENARKIVANAPSTPEAHIETITKAIKDGISVFTFSGSSDKLTTFAEEVVSKLK
jgi:alkanesulfonate monooxygenase SsuD/methylene tetrahydromethanopterin reductase-like flavin-dependent oxidoreductase (luciferase family)